MYYRNANCAVVVYDITQAASLEKARSWIRELQRQADRSIVIALCGNKSDLSARRQVTEEEAKRYADEEGLMWTETSAKTGEGVSEIFAEIGEYTVALGLLPHHLRVTARKLPLTAPPSARGAAGRPAGPQSGVDLKKQTGSASGQNEQCNC
jgi:Ras-related protein Rab-5C